MAVGAPSEMNLNEAIEQYFVLLTYAGGFVVVLGGVFGLARGRLTELRRAADMDVLQRPRSQF